VTKESGVNSVEYDNVTLRIIMTDRGTFKYFLYQAIFHFPHLSTVIFGID